MTDMAASDDEHSVFDFFGLAREIRDLIYEELIQ